MKEEFKEFKRDSKKEQTGPHTYHILD